MNDLYRPNNGTEFQRNFIPLLVYFSVKLTCTAIKNSQVDSILKRIHQVVGSILKTNDLSNVMFDAVDPWINILISIAYSVGYSYHSMLQATPGQFVFGRDMILDIYFQLNYKQMWLRKQKLIKYYNKHENAKRVEYDYEVGHYAYILRDGN